MKRRSLKSQLSLTIALIVLLTVIVISILSNLFINYRFRAYVMKRQDEKTEELVRNLSRQYDVEKQEWNMDFIHIIGMYALYDGYIIKVYDPDGEEVWDAEYHDMSLCNEVMSDITSRMARQYPAASGEFTSVKYPLKQGEASAGHVTISYYGPYFLSESDFDFLHALNIILVSVGGASLASALCIGWIMARKISRPVTDLTDMTRQIADGNYGIRSVEQSRVREVYDLTASVDQLADSLEKQEQLRKKLTADIAHELRTPLTTTGTHIEAMIEGVWEPTRERLESCHEEIRRITDLVQDLENLAKAESENLKLEKQRTDLRALAEDVVRKAEAEIHQKRLRVQICGGAVEAGVDKERIRQVLINLMSNAIKYTEECGEIKVRLSRDGQQVVLEVSDTGSGIPESELPFIFERFYRSDKSRNRKTGGAGIGLAIVKSIVEAHDGSVSVKSTLEQGSTFRVMLPYACSDAPVPRTQVRG